MLPADIFLVALLTIGWPLYDRLVEWPDFLRRVQVDPARARRMIYARTIVTQWLLAAAALGVWMNAHRAPEALGLGLPTRWRLALGAGVVIAFGTLYLRQVPVVARSERLRRVVSARMDAMQLREMLPRSEGDLGRFIAVSVTAGVCEELLFRGYLIFVLAPLLGWWGAAALAVAVFGLLHAYQGREGVLRTAAVGAVMTVLVFATRSLLPAMLLHAMIDIGSGSIAWVVRAERQPALVG